MGILPKSTFGVLICVATWAGSITSARAEPVGVSAPNSDFCAVNIRANGTEDSNKAQYCNRFPGTAFLFVEPHRNCSAPNERFFVAQCVTGEIGLNNGADATALRGTLLPTGQTYDGVEIFKDADGQLYSGPACGFIPSSTDNLRCSRLQIAMPTNNRYGKGSFRDAYEKDLALINGMTDRSNGGVSVKAAANKSATDVTGASGSGPGNGGPGSLAGTPSEKTAQGRLQRLECAAGDAACEDANRRIDEANKNGGAIKGKTARSEDQDPNDHLGTEAGCEVSSGLGGKYSCQATRDLVDNSKVVNQLGQTVGAIGVGVQGAAAQQTAATQGTQSAALEGAAQTQKFGAGAQALGGAVNVVMGAMQMRAGSQHKDNENGFKSATASSAYTQDRQNQVVSRRGAESEGGQLLNAYHLNDAYKMPERSSYPAGPQGDSLFNADLKARQDAIAKKSGQLARKGAAEQNAVRGQANQGAFLSMVTGAQQLGNAALGYMAAKQMEEAAQKLKDAENKAGPLVTPPGADSFPGGPSGSTTITGDGSNPNQSQASADSGGSSGGAADDLGQGFDPRGADTTPGAGPAPGAFKGGGAAAGNGAGPGGGIGAANTSAAQGGNQDEPQARMANAGAPVSFDSGGGNGSMVGGSGGGAPGVGGFDPLAMLNALKKDAEEDKKDKGSILDYAGRSPAGEPIGSYLDRNVNIFRRIEGTLREKTLAQKLGREFEKRP